MTETQTECTLCNTIVHEDYHNVEGKIQCKRCYTHTHWDTRIYAIKMEKRLEIAEEKIEELFKVVKQLKALNRPKKPY